MNAVASRSLGVIIPVVTLVWLAACIAKITWWSEVEWYWVTVWAIPIRFAWLAVLASVIWDLSVAACGTRLSLRISQSVWMVSGLVVIVGALVSREECACFGRWDAGPWLRAIVGVLTGACGVVFFLTRDRRRGW